MREDAFRAFLAPRLGAASIESYVDYATRIERELGIDLDHADLDDHALVRIRAALERRDVARKSIGNGLTALRRYAEMRERR